MRGKKGETRERLTQWSETVPDPKKKKRSLKGYECCDLAKVCGGIECLYWKTRKPFETDEFTETRFSETYWSFTKESQGSRYSHGHRLVRRRRRSITSIYIHPTISLYRYACFLSGKKHDMKKKKSTPQSRKSFVTIPQLQAVDSSLSANVRRG